MPKIINNACLVFLIIGSAASCKLNSESPSHYTINLTLDPASQFIGVEGNLKLIINDTAVTQLSFRIHKQFSIKSFSVNGIQQFKIDTTGASFSPNSIALIFNLGKPIGQGEIINVEFKYDGEITEWSEWGANAITTDWVEIGIYFPWFPNVFSRLPATYHLEIECPSEYKVFGMGDISKVENKWIIEQNEPTNDIVVFASPDMSIHETMLTDMTLVICQHNMTDPVLKTFSADLEKVYQLYSKWFGAIKNPELFFIESKREAGGGYARTGEIVFPSFKNLDYFSNRAMYNSYIGHEISHFWWNKAKSNSWQDWLNEAFAEYSGLLIVRELFGNSAFEKQLQDRAKDIDNKKPIWGISRTDNDAYVILYHKGAVILNELELKIGKEAFLQLCQSCHIQKIDTTSEFLTLLESLEGKEISDWFEQKLKM